MHILIKDNQVLRDWGGGDIQMKEFLEEMRCGRRGKKGTYGGSLGGPAGWRKAYHSHPLSASRVLEVERGSLLWVLNYPRSQRLLHMLGGDLPGSSQKESKGDPL